MPPRKKPAARKTAAKKRKAPEPEPEPEAVEAPADEDQVLDTSEDDLKARFATPRPPPSTRSSTAGSSAVWRRRARI